MITAAVFGAIVQRFSVNRSEPPVEKRLPGRIVQLLLHAEYATLISHDLSLRALYLEEIACLHTRRELLGHVKIGPKTVADVEEWLASKGRRLRRYNEDLSAVICSFRIKRRAPSNSACSITSDSATVVKALGNQLNSLPVRPLYNVFNLIRLRAMEFPEHEREMFEHAAKPNFERTVFKRWCGRGAIDRPDER